MAESIPYGVASGDVTAEEVTLWASLNGSGDVTVTVARNGEGVWRTNESATTVGPKRWRVSGLIPGTRYTYTVEHGGESSTGMFRTLPAGGALRFAVVTCAKFNSGYFNAYARVADRDDLDFVLHMGDYIYEAGDTPLLGQAPGAGIGRTFDPVSACVTYEDYTRRYAQYRSDPDVQALHRSHAMWATLDDHELADNAYREGAEAHDDVRDGDWRLRRHGALRAWHDWMPTTRNPLEGDDVWTAFAVPGLATIALLETRLDRDGPTIPRELRSALGKSESEWLARLVANVETPWLVLGSPSMLTPIHGMSYDEDATWALRKLKLRSLTEDQPYDDLWDSFPVERDTVLRQLAASPATPVVLSGDVHISVSSTLSVDGGVVGPEWVTTSVTSPNLDDKCGWTPRADSLQYEDAVRRAVRAIEWCDFDSHGYMIITISPSEARAEWWAVDTVLERSSGERKAYEDTWKRDNAEDRASS